MRELTSHKVNGTNDKLDIHVMDMPGHGGASHEYLILWPVDGGCQNSTIKFQNGPIKEHGVNGLTHEALLAIIIDRLQGFQSGPFATEDNACALASAEQTMYFLQKRTRERLARGVEGTLQK